MARTPARKELHPVQEKLLKLLTRHADDPLSIRDLQKRVGASSTSVVAHHIAQLEKKGFLKRNPLHAADYQVLHGAPEKLISYINLYGLAQCGPEGRLLDGQPIERIPIASRLISFPVAEAFMVKARGDSMAPRINAGDLVIARRAQTADSSALVVCRNKGEALIKKISREHDQIILVSLNPEYPPFLAARDFHIEGVVKSVLSHQLD